MTTVTPSSGRGPLVDALLGHADAGRPPLVDDRRGASRRRTTRRPPRRWSARRPRPPRAPRPTRRRSRSSDARTRAASAWAAVGPTCRIDSATSTRHSGRCLGRLEVVEQLGGVRARGSPSCVGEVAGSVGQLRRRSGRTGHPRRPARRRRAAPSPPRSRAPRCRSAPRPARWNTRSRSWAGQERAFGQRMSTSPSLAGASGVPHSGQCGRHHERALGAVAQVDDRPDDLGDDVAGLAQHHGVADQHALALDLVLRCAGWPCSTVEPATRTGSMHAERRDPAGAPDVDPDVEQLGGDLLRRVLERDRPARRPLRRAEPALQRRSSTLTTTPSISCSTSCRCSP